MKKTSILRLISAFAAACSFTGVYYVQSLTKCPAAPALLVIIGLALGFYAVLGKTFADDDNYLYKGDNGSVTDEK